MARKLRSPVVGIIVVLVLAVGAVSALVGASSAAVVRPTLIFVNDADQNGTFSATETVPFNATYPLTVQFHVTLSTAGMSQSVTIKSVANTQTNSLGNCPAALVGKT